MVLLFGLGLVLVVRFGLGLVLVLRFGLFGRDLVLRFGLGPGRFARLGNCACLVFRDVLGPAGSFFFVVAFVFGFGRPFAGLGCFLCFDHPLDDFLALLVEFGESNAHAVGFLRCVWVVGLDPFDPADSPEGLASIGEQQFELDGGAFGFRLFAGDEDPTLGDVFRISLHERIQVWILELDLERYGGSLVSPAIFHDDDPGAVQTPRESRPRRRLMVSPRRITV